MTLALPRKPLQSVRMTDEVRELDLGFLPNAGAPMPTLLSRENGATVIAFFGQPTNGTSDQVPVVIEVTRCLVATFGYPSDEALPGHPLYAAGLRHYAVFEVIDSSWKERIIKQNRHSFSNTPPQYATLRHFVVTFHDSTFECLAQDINARATTGTTESILRPYLSGV
jgi:hypothetical protein